jgi:hypothetical protein
MYWANVEVSGHAAGCKWSQTYIFYLAFSKELINICWDIGLYFLPDVLRF